MTFTFHQVRADLSERWITSFSYSDLVEGWPAPSSISRDGKSSLITFLGRQRIKLKRISYRWANHVGCLKTMFHVWRAYG